MSYPLPDDTQNGFFNTAEGNYPELEDLSWLDSIINDVGGVTEEGGTMGQPPKLSSQSDTSPSIVQNSESPSENLLGVTAGEKLTGQKSPKRPKGRPKRIHEGPESAAQRRREQIRQAQQAYRNRKEETIALLKEENNQLKSRLEVAEKSLNQLLEASAQNEIQSDGFQTSLLVESSAYNVNQTLNSSLESSLVLSHGQSSVVSGMICPNQAMNQALFQHLLQYTPPESLPLSLRLRYEGLKKGYNVITDQETPNSKLALCFKHYLFSSTRQEILIQINSLLYQSSKVIQHNLAPPKPSAKEDSSSEANLSRGFPLLDLYSRDVDGYVVAEGVEKYLLEKGLKVDPGSNHFTLPPSTAVSKQGPRTLFDEIQGGRELHLSVPRLLQELVNRVICLRVGPGLRTQEIDEAIQATIMATI